IFTSGRVSSNAVSARAVAYAEGVLRAMFLTRLKVAVLVLLLVGCLAVGGIVTHRALAVAPAEGKEEKADRPRAVRVVKVRRGGLPGKSRHNGTVEPWEREEVAAAVSGVVKGLAVDLGDRVRKGQVLAEVNAPLLVLGEKQAAAALLQARGLV